MNYSRLRVQKRIQQILSEVIFREVHQDELKSITITEVELTRDYSYATIYFYSQTIQDADEEVLLLSLMQKCSGFLRKRLGETIRLRKVPELRFKVDHSFEHAARMEELFRKIATPETEENDANDEDSDS